MSDERLKPCPFCGISLYTLTDSPLFVYRHPENECLLANCIINEKGIGLWNTRKPMERIVERLEQQKQQYKRRSEEAKHVLQRDHFFGKMCSYDHAIEIVKGGGVDDND